MQAPEPPRHDREHSLAIALIEAYGLALAGRFDEAERLITASLKPAGNALETPPNLRAEMQLALARIALARGLEQDRARAKERLEALALAKDDSSWRAAVELARLARCCGDVPEAASLLKRAIEAFRDVPAEPGIARTLLAGMLSAEVGTLACDPVPRLASHRSREEREAERVEPALLLRLIELGKRLAGQDDPADVLRLVLHEAIEITGTERGFVVLPHGEEFEFALAENLDWTEVDKPSFEVSRTLIRGVLDTGRPLVLHLPDLPEADPARRSLVEIGARTVACLPILHEGRTLGVLYLDGRSSSTCDAATQRLLELFASQAGAALVNALAHQSKAHALEAAEETLRRERSAFERRTTYGQLVGSSDAMQEVYRKLDTVSATELPVLILGETGTGKELAARLIHARGSRASKTFVAANCAGIAESLLETELFGHERGAFTGAERARPGLFELAHGGTLFLDEIGDMSTRMQADILRVLQSGEVRRVGGRETFHVDVRVIAATHRDLEELQRRGEFRQDLYYRLNVLALRLPSLRERAEDIPLLVSELIARATAEGRQPIEISERAMHRFVAYSWPGNVRELENIVRRLTVLGVPTIDERHLPEELLRTPGSTPRAGSLQRAEAVAVRQAMAASHGNKAAAARILGVDRKTLYAKLRRLDRAPEGPPGSV